MKMTFDSPPLMNRELLPDPASGFARLRLLHEKALNPVPLRSLRSQTRLARVHVDDQRGASHHILVFCEYHVTCQGDCAWPEIVHSVIAGGSA